MIAWPRGRQLGGSSAINLALWNRASRADIDSWANLGNDGWSWEDLLPYFKKAETFNEPDSDIAEQQDIDWIESEFHGEDGPIQASFQREYDPFQQAWNPTFENLGFGITGDPFNGEALGGFTTPMSVDSETVVRSYAANAYFLPNAERENLKVLTSALAQKIIFADGTGEGKKKDDVVATGLEFSVDGSTCVVEANREVILSAGVVQSPQLLELSGVGSKEILEPLGIDVIVENDGVGENLQDHAHTNVGFEVEEGLPTLTQFRDPEFAAAAVQAFVTNGTGYLTNLFSSASYLSYAQLLDTEGVEGTSAEDITKIKGPKEDKKRISGLKKQYDEISDKLENSDEAVTEQIHVPGGFNYERGDSTTLLFTAPPGESLTFYAVLLHPYSRGNIHVTSADPTEYPRIDPRYLSHPADLEILSTIALQTQAVAKTDPFASLLKDKASVYAPNYYEITPENVEEHVKNTLSTLYHPIGTCSMMPEKDNGVVDSNLKVYGTSNVRVIDASIAPLLPRGTISSLVYAIAEKGADIIKARYEDYYEK